MKLIYAATVVAAVLMPGAAFAQTTTTTTTTTTTAPAPAAKFNLDTPIEVLMADEKAKAVLTANFGIDLSTHGAYDQFKQMSLNQVMPVSQGQVTPEMLAKIEPELAAIK